MSKNKTPHFFDEENQSNTAGAIFLGTLWLLVTGVGLMKSFALTSVDQETSGVELLSCVSLALGVFGIVISIPIPFFKFEEYQLFKSTPRNSTSRRK